MRGASITERAAWQLGPPPAPHPVTHQNLSLTGLCVCAVCVQLGNQTEAKTEYSVRRQSSCGCALCSVLCALVVRGQGVEGQGSLFWSVLPANGAHHRTGTTEGVP